MFTVLEIADGKTARKCRRSRPQLVRVQVRGGSFFYVLRVPRRGDLPAAFRMAARCAPVVLTALPVPPDMRVRLFEPRVFPLRRAAAVLCGILPRTRLPPQKLTVGVCDPDGALCGETHALLPLASDVRIVTGKPDAFAADALSARRLFGASLTVGEDAALLARCDAVVCAVPDAAFRDAPVILSCRPADGAFSLLPAQLPQAYAHLRPASVPTDLFAAALAERCGVRSPEWYDCRGTVFGEERPDAEETAALWRTCIESSASSQRFFLDN